MIKNIFLVFFSLISFTLLGQNEIQTKKNYYESGNVKSEINFIEKGGKKIREGKSSWWYETGELKHTQFYKKGSLDGERISYWQNGKVKRKDVFKKGKLKSGICYDESGKEVEYYDFEIQPKYPGGKEALNQLIKDNFSIYQNTVSGRLIFRFNIESSGKVSNPRIIQDTNPSLKNEVLKLFDSMLDWEPAKQDGIAIKVTRTIPVNFN